MRNLLRSCYQKRMRVGANDMPKDTRHPCLGGWRAGRPEHRSRTNKQRVPAANKDRRTTHCDSEDDATSTINTTRHRDLAKHRARQRRLNATRHRESHLRHAAPNTSPCRPFHRHRDDGDDSTHTATTAPATTQHNAAHPTTSRCEDHAPARRWRRPNTLA